LKEVYKKIGQNVKRIRENKNITQLQLSEMIGHKSTTIIAQAEIGEKKHFNIEHLYRISKALNVPLCEFFRGID
jgi:putative transcriptional regulator